MSELATDLDRRWSWLLRRGPYVLLVATVVLCLATGPAFGTADRAPLIIGLSVLLAAGHRWCGDRPRDEPDDGLGHVYVIVRTLVAFVLTWLNPLGSLYAAAGYFDAERYARGRWAMVSASAARSRSRPRSPAGCRSTARSTCSSPCC